MRSCGQAAPPPVEWLPPAGGGAEGSTPAHTCRRVSTTAGASSRTLNCVPSSLENESSGESVPLVRMTACDERVRSCIATAGLRHQSENVTGMPSRPDWVPWVSVSIPPPPPPASPLPLPPLRFIGWMDPVVQLLREP